MLHTKNNNFFKSNNQMIISKKKILKILVILDLKFFRFYCFHSIIHPFFWKYSFVVKDFCCHKSIYMRIKKLIKIDVLLLFFFIWQ